MYYIFCPKVVILLLKDQQINILRFTDKIVSWQLLEFSCKEQADPDCILIKLCLQNEAEDGI